MKLKNRKTGEIVELQGELTFDDKVRMLKHYNSLAELCEEWKDYSPKYYSLSTNGRIDEYTWDDTTGDNMRKELGNYFSSREEAELAVRKLQAWKRLKDNGFRFERWKKSCNTDGKIIFHLDELGPRLANFRDDLDILFESGGEE